ncbi:MAG: hypothetical protein AB1481_03280, partial [Candidatus Omnitrophota bacterium]
RKDGSKERVIVIHPEGFSDDAHLIADLNHEIQMLLLELKGEVPKGATQNYAEITGAKRAIAVLDKIIDDEKVDPGLRESIKNIYLPEGHDVLADWQRGEELLQPYRRQSYYKFIGAGAIVLGLGIGLGWIIRRRIKQKVSSSRESKKTPRRSLKSGHSGIRNAGSPVLDRGLIEQIDELMFWVGEQEKRNEKGTFGIRVTPENFKAVEQELKARLRDTELVLTDPASLMMNFRILGPGPGNKRKVVLSPPSEKGPVDFSSRITQIRIEKERAARYIPKTQSIEFKRTPALLNRLRDLKAHEQLRAINVSGLDLTSAAFYKELSQLADPEYEIHFSKIRNSSIWYFRNYKEVLGGGKIIPVHSDIESSGFFSGDFVKDTIISIDNCGHAHPTSVPPGTEQWISLPSGGDLLAIAYEYELKQAPVDHRLVSPNSICLVSYKWHSNRIIYKVMKEDIQSGEPKRRKLIRELLGYREQNDAAGYLKRVKELGFELQFTNLLDISSGSPVRNRSKSFDSQRTTRIKVIKQILADEYVNKIAKKLLVRPEVLLTLIGVKPACSVDAMKGRVNVLKLFSHMCSIIKVRFKGKLSFIYGQKLRVEAAFLFGEPKPIYRFVLAN